MNLAIAPSRPPRQQLWSPTSFVLMLLGGGIAMLLSLALAVFFLIRQLLDPAGTGVSASVGLAGSILLAGLSAPVSWIGVAGLRGASAPPRTRPPGRLMWLLPLVPILLGLGHWALITGRQPQIVVPIAHVLVLGISVGLTILLAMVAAPVMSAWRVWLHFFSGLWITSLLALAAEVALAAFGALLFLLTASGSPDAQGLLALLAGAFADPSALSDPQLMAGLAFNPVVVFGAAFVLGLAVPMVEELAKPVGVGFLLRWRPSQAQAFVGGVLGGAGFALLESLFSLPNELAWSTTVAGRIGTVGLHAFTAGLGGWALALIFRAGQVRRGLLMMAGSVGLHSAWNVSLLVSAYGLLLSDIGGGLAPAATIGGMMIGSSALVVLLLAAACYAAIPWLAGILYRREAEGIK